MTATTDTVQATFEGETTVLPDNFAQLKARCVELGYFERPTFRVLCELAYHVGVFLAGLSIMIVADYVLVSAAGLCLVTFGICGVGTNTHTSAHYATSRRAWVNEFLTYFGYPFFLQVSATYWWNKHNVRHHPSPNQVDTDPDVDLSPWLALTQPSAPAKSWRYRLQWLVFPVLVSMNSFGIQFGGWKYLMRSLLDPEVRRRKHWIDLGALVLHWSAWIVIPCFFFPVASVIAFNVARALAASYGLFAILGPGHYPHEAVAYRQNGVRPDFVLRQTATTVNFRTGFFGRLLCSGLDFHIEHHLFPGMAHVYYPRASRLVRAYCERHGFPYRSYSWPVAIWKAWANLYDPKTVGEGVVR